MKLVYQASGRSLIILHTHFDYEAQAIDRSARVLKGMDRAKYSGASAAGDGDFNADKSLSAHQLLISGSPALRDVLREANPRHAHEGTFHGFGKVAEPAPIDWMLASHHLDVLNAGIDRYHTGSLYPSDHFPLTGTLAWKEMQLQIGHSGSPTRDAVVTPVRPPLRAC